MTKHFNTEKDESIKINMHKLKLLVYNLAL